MDGRFAKIEGELRGVARTRTVVLANLGSMIGVAALVLAAVRLG
jgi:hypothetical protein